MHHATACASCSTPASTASPLRLFVTGNVRIKLCDDCRNSAEAASRLTRDSIGRACASCGDEDISADVVAHPLIPTLGQGSTTVNLCRSCRSPVEEWQGTMEEGRRLEELGITTSLTGSKRADAIVKEVGPIAHTLAAMGNSPGLIAKELNRRGYVAQPGHEWTGETAHALVLRYRQMWLGGDGKAG